MNFYFIGLLALINNNIYWIFLKNSEYKQIMNNFVGLDTPNSKIMPYALNIVYIMNSEKTLVHTIQTIIPQTANCLSLNTVICRYDTVPWYVIWQSSIRRHTRHAAVWLSAKPTLHSTVITYISSVSISI